MNKQQRWNKETNKQIKQIFELERKIHTRILNKKFDHWLCKQLDRLTKLVKDYHYYLKE